MILKSFKYLFFEGLPGYIFLIMFAFFIHALVNNKFLGHTIVILTYIVNIALETNGFEHKLYLLGTTPSFTLSDMNGLGHFMKAVHWFQLYWMLIGTVLMGFMGVVMTLRPTMDQNQLFAGVIGLLSGMGSALAYMQVTALGRVGEPEERTVFYFSVGSAVVGITGMLFTNFTPWSAVRWQDAAWLIPIGILASLGQWCMTRAYSKGATLVVASMQYFGIVFAVGFSLALFGDHIEPLGWAGIAVIVTSGVLATILRSRALPKLPAEEH